MPSQFFGLNIAYSGLLAANAALNTTNNNISNVETKGYSRQATVTQAAAALRVFETYGCAGAGVDTLAIERIRNEFYDYKYWNNNTRLGEYDIKQYYMKQIETYLMDDPEKGINGFNTIFDDMYDALAEIKKSSGDATKKGQFVGWANSLTDYFNDTATNLQKMQKDINLEIKNKVEEINSIAQEISVINKQINVVEMSGGAANELRDKRTLLVDQLSAIVDVEVSEIPIMDSNDPTRDTGASRFRVKIAGGHSLVDMDSYNKLICTARKSNEKVNQSDADGLYDIEFENSGLEINLYGENLGGELKALVQMRDGNNGEYFNGSVAAGGVNQKVINGDNRTTVKIDVTHDYLKDINKSTLSDTGGYIRLGNEVYKYDSWTMTTKIAADGTKTTSYEFLMSKDNEKMPDASREGEDASAGTRVNYQGIPYYQQQLNEWSRTFSECFNNILTQPGAMNEIGLNSYYLFVANDKNSNSQLKFADHKWVTNNNDGSKTLTVGTGDDSYYRMTAMNFGVNKDLIDHPEYLATHTGNVDEEDKYDIVEELVNLKTDKNKMSFRNSSAGQFLECLQSDIALNAKSANVFYSNYTNISHSIEVQRTSISGVDNDEEAMNLVKYQHAFNLASKMIQTLTEVYDRLILQTGV